MMRRSSALALATEPFLLVDEPVLPQPVASGTRRVKVRAHRRTVRGPAAPTGVERKEVALDAFTADEALKAAREYARAELVALYRHRVAWYGGQPERHHVTADDIAEILEAWADCPASVRSRPGHWKGSLFRKGWRMTGRSVPSRRRHMHATTLPCWALVEEGGHG